MSLILEALKRSETERVAKARNASSLATSGFGVSNNNGRSKWWLPLLGIALLVNAVVFGYFIFSTDNIPAMPPLEDQMISSRDDVLTTRENPVQPSATTEPTIIKQAAQTQTTTPKEVKAATALAEELLRKPATANKTQNQNFSNAQSNAAPAIPADFAMLETQEVKTQPVASPPPVTLQQLNDSNLSERLKSYEINTHIYNEEDNSRSFVLINMQKYREGDVLAGSDFEIAGITAEGVVVNHSTGQVLLSPN